MADTLARLVVDCSVVVKWKISSEDYAAAADELLLDWESHAVDVWAPTHLQAEVVSAFLRAHRRGRITEEEAREAIRDLLALPFVLRELAAVADYAVRMAQRYDQRAYDCLYVALADEAGVPFWTGDQRRASV